MNDDTNVRAIAGQEKDDIKKFVDTNPTMAEAFPRTLPCGKRLDNLDLFCSQCSKVIDPTLCHVDAQRMEFASKSVDTFNIKSVCTDCRVVTSYFMRFHSDSSYDTLIRGKWHRGSLNPTSPPKHKRITNGIKSFLFGSGGR